jgi:hypothetical protein
MPTGGVADDCDSVKIEVDAPGRKSLEMVYAKGGIFHCCRPPGLGSSQPTVFQVPDGEAAGNQVVSDAGHLVPAMGHPPKPAV